MALRCTGATVARTVEGPPPIFETSRPTTLPEDRLKFAERLSPLVSSTQQRASWAPPPRAAATRVQPLKPPCAFSKMQWSADVTITHLISRGMWGCRTESPVGPPALTECRCLGITETNVWYRLMPQASWGPCAGKGSACQNSGCGHKQSMQVRILKNIGRRYQVSQYNDSVETLKSAPPSSQQPPPPSLNPPPLQPNPPTRLQSKAPSSKAELGLGLCWRRVVRGGLVGVLAGGLWLEGALAGRGGFACSGLWLEGFWLEEALAGGGWRGVRNWA